MAFLGYCFSSLPLSWLYLLAMLHFCCSWTNDSGAGMLKSASQEVKNLLVDL